MLGSLTNSFETSAFTGYVGVAAVCVPGSAYFTASNLDPFILNASYIAFDIANISSSLNVILIVSVESVPPTSGISTFFLETTI